jgi:uncharacterized protein YkwD
VANWLCRWFPWLPGCRGPRPSPDPPNPVPSGPPGDPAELVTLINQRRVSAGLRVMLQYDPRLASAASKHNKLMARTSVLSHQLPGEPGLTARVTTEGVLWSSVSEIIAAGQSSAAQAVQDWMDSPGHRAAILGDYTIAGAAIDTTEVPGGHTYYTVDFAIVTGSRGTAGTYLASGIDRRTPADPF